jgi:catechol 2,3-dioxygenase-like lactoylglutathione lyase family enzyme
MTSPEHRSTAGLHRTIPALPVRNVNSAVAFYRDRFGFDAGHHSDDFAVLVRDDAVLHLWGATDQDWRARKDLDQQPICSGAESFLAGYVKPGVI